MILEISAIDNDHAYLALITLSFDHVHSCEIVFRYISH